VKPGKERALFEAIERGTLGAGSVAEGVYLRNMQDARLFSDGTARWVEVCYCSVPLEEERPYWEEVLRHRESAGRPRPSQLPRRERQRALGLRRLRLHGALGTASHRSSAGVPANSQGRNSPQRHRQHREENAKFKMANAKGDFKDQLQHKRLASISAGDR
jgi:hypothetical protein